MKKIIGISLGSSKRDYKTVLNLNKDKVSIQRIGTNGDFDKAKKLFKKFDNKIDAFGLGGIDFTIGINKDRYRIKEAVDLIKSIKTPVFDGNGIKDILDNYTLDYIIKNNIVKIKDKKVFMVCASNRYGMAMRFEKLNCKMTYGDIMFGLKLPIPIHSLKVGKRVSKIILPLATMMPYKFLYPIGKNQTESKPKFVKYFEDADIIAGDFHYINKYSPLKLKNKVIITTTTTKEDIRKMKKKGVSCIITVTPEINERSFGSNIMEAMFYSLLKSKSEFNNYEDIIKKLKLIPSIKIFH